MARATPREIRWKVIILWKLFNYSVPQTCQALGLTRASVYNFRKLYTDTGRVDVDVARRGRMPKLTESEATALVQHMKINPSHHSSDFQTWFERKFGKRLSKSTIGRYFHMNGYRKGKNRREWVQVDISRKESKTNAFDDVPKLDFKSCFDTFLESGMGDTIIMETPVRSPAMSDDGRVSPDSLKSVDGCGEGFPALGKTDGLLRSLLELNPLASLPLPKCDGAAAGNPVDFVKYFDEFVASFGGHSPSQLERKDTDASP
eukprot:m.40346 g.40346  ORF g.40346 m.40346 type:complete len:260 (+) comp32950_c0_seq1:93-872(+)